MKPIAQMPVDGIAGIVTDLDETLTRHERLVPEAYGAMCTAADAGLRVVVATGRPGGYADVISSLFPVEATIAENGGLARIRGGELVYWDAAGARAEHAERLEQIKRTALERFSFARLSEDYPLRRVDLAFDIGERQHLPPSETAQIVEHIRSHGARVQVSSLHAHAYFGDHDKARMSARIAEKCFGAGEDELRRRYVFIGDSPNDQAGFAYFERSVGVANVRPYLDRLSPPPAYVTDGEGGHGFAELVSHILARRP